MSAFQVTTTQLSMSSSSMRPSETMCPICPAVVASRICLNALLCQTYLLSQGELSQDCRFLLLIFLFYQRNRKKTKKKMGWGCGGAAVTRGEQQGADPLSLITMSQGDQGLVSYMFPHACVCHDPGLVTQY